MPGSLHIHEARRSETCALSFCSPGNSTATIHSGCRPSSPTGGRILTRRLKLASLFDVQVYKHYRMFQLEL